MFIQVSKSMDSKIQSNEELNKLWSDIRAGKSESLSKLFCFSYSWLFSYGYKIIPKEAFVKDAIQELFLILWKKRETINDAISVKSYLFSSLRRIIFRRLQKKRSRMKRNHDYKKHRFKEIYNIEELMIHFETDRHQKSQLADAIQSLSKRQKEAIYLKFYNGLSNNEIAQVMEINKQSVYNHVSKAINKMQEFIGV